MAPGYEPTTFRLFSALITRPWPVVKLISFFFNFGQNWACSLVKKIRDAMSQQLFTPKDFHFIVGIAFLNKKIYLSILFFCYLEIYQKNVEEYNYWPLVILHRSDTSNKKSSYLLHLKACCQLILKISAFLVS